MNLKQSRKNAAEYLKEYKKLIPKRTSLFSKNSSIDISKIHTMKEKTETFYERKVLISPMLIDKNSIKDYQETLALIKQFPSDMKPETVMENKILEQTRTPQKTRRILLPNIVDNNLALMEDYDNMVAYYLLMDGDSPVERFAKTEMSMKQYGVKPDLGLSITKYGDKITSKLEELASSGNKSSKEWECFKKQVLHSFNTAEKIGNYHVNPEEHLQWEERLVKLGILERKLDRGNKQKTSSLRDSIKYDVDTPKTKNDENDKNRGTVSLESALQKNAEQMYINTGMIPLGYKKDENGKLVRILPDKNKERVNPLSASRENLSATKTTQKQGLSR